MNSQRRKAIADISGRLSVIQEELDTVAGEEEEYRDSIPESMTNKFEEAEQAADNLRDAADTLGEIIGNLEELTN